MHFKKYNDIENTYRQMYVDKVIGQGLSGGQWVASEKVHGSNLSMWCDGKRVTLGKRKGWTGTDFYNCGEVLERHQDQVMQLFNRFDDIEVLTVYGELYGVGVQKGIEYPEGRYTVEDLYQYVTENRLRNVISKEGKIGQKEFGKLLGLFMQDVLKDYQKDNEIDLKSEFGDEWKAMQKYVNGEAATVIRKNFQSIVDGEF